jgi:Radical SAM superfamily
MASYRLGDLDILIDQWGSRQYAKVSYPLRYGRFSEIVSPEFRCQFNLNGELRFVQGRGREWPHPAEWLKRSAGGDWIYYSSGEYRETIDLFGEYYLPRLSYRSNCIFSSNPFENADVNSATQAWEALSDQVNRFLAAAAPGPLGDFLLRLSENGPGALRRKAERLHALLGGRVTALPPDTRHVDYDVLPVVVADGCLYHCGFCSVKSPQSFQVRSPEKIREQIEGVRELYARDLPNYNSVFLAHHDALAAGGARVEFAAKEAYEAFEIGSSCMEGARLFLFGSADSLTRAPEDVFKTIEGLPFRTYVNVGLESADSETLEALEKPISVRLVEQAFERMLEINRSYPNIEVSANFVFGRNLPPGHLPSLVSLTQRRLERFWEKGALYLSPLLDRVPLRADEKRTLLEDFREVKMRARLPTFLYLIQRL